MQNDKQKTGVCMACECPCATHQEHTHSDTDKAGSVNTCKMCGHEHKSGGSCNCGCK